MSLIQLSIRTSAREELVDITRQVAELPAIHNWRDGALMLYCPHTTGAVTINEGADPDVARDILTTLRALIPRHGNYRHAEGNSDAHLKTALTGPSQLVPLAGGQLQLGTWQRIFFCEFDGPRSRTLWCSFLPGA